MCLRLVFTYDCAYSRISDHVVVKRQGGGEGEGLDADVDIEGDGDVDDFGPYQYEEGDLIPCGGDSSEEEEKREDQFAARLDGTLSGRDTADATTSV